MGTSLLAMASNFFPAIFGVWAVGSNFLFAPAHALAALLNGLLATALIVTSYGMLTVAEFIRREQRLAPVDQFFRVLADTHGPRSACVILSGTGPNGSAGLKRIKEYGGLVVAQ